MIASRNRVCRGLPKHSAPCKAMGTRYTDDSTETDMPGERCRKRPMTMLQKFQYLMIDAIALRKGETCAHSMVNDI